MARRRARRDGRPHLDRLLEVKAWQESGLSLDEIRTRRPPRTAGGRLAPAHGPRYQGTAPPPSFDQRVPPSRAQAVRPLDVLVQLQRADGSWDLTAEFAGFVSLTLRRLEKELRHATGDSDRARSALATALAIAWLDAARRLV
ncbi:MAG: hypothetical protein R6V57_01955 [Vicinamibacterales bacterium]